MFTKTDTKNISHLEERQVQECLETIDITEEGVKKKLAKLNASKSAGPDGHHLRVVKEFKTKYFTPLKLIFTKSLEEGYLPQNWWEANVTPVFKRDQKSKVTN